MMSFWNRQSFWTDTRGQSTTEYALVLTAFLAMILALGALWRMGEQGVLSDFITDSGSHILSSSDPAGQIIDILLY